MNEIWNVVEGFFGVGKDSKDLSVVEVSARAALLFVYTLALVRFGDKRFLSRKTAFDAVLGFILASVMARAVNGSAPLLPTMVGGMVIVGLHRFFAFLAMQWHPFGVLIKGNNAKVIEEGVLDRKVLRHDSFSMHDLMQDLRASGVCSVEEVKEAHIERNGQISVVKK